MTTTATESTLMRALMQAASQAATQLPTLGDWTLDPVASDVAPGLPAAARAVVAPLAGLGRLVIVVAGPLARAVQVGPPPAEDLLDGLAPIVIGIGQLLNAAAGPLAEHDADLAVLLSPDESLTAVRLLDGDEHTATVALIVHADVADQAVELPGLDMRPTSGNHAVEGHPLEALSDVELGVTVELGRTRMLLGEVLGLTPGAVIELDRAAGSPVDILVNGTLIARGEVVVIDEEYGVRLTEVVGPDNRGRS